MQGFGGAEAATALDKLLRLVLGLLAPGLLEGAPQASPWLTPLPWDAPNLNPTLTPTPTPAPVCMAPAGPSMSSVSPSVVSPAARKPTQVEISPCPIPANIAASSIHPAAAQPTAAAAPQPERVTTIPGRGEVSGEVGARAGA